MSPVLTENPNPLEIRPESGDKSLHGDALKLICWTVVGLFRSRASLEAENMTLRHQLNVLQRKPDRESNEACREHPRRGCESAWGPDADRLIFVKPVGSITGADSHFAQEPSLPLVIFHVGNGIVYIP
jgi:hypothetical protein